MTNKEEAITICLPVACGNPCGFDDSVYGECSECHQAIQWRPHALQGPKICLPCAMDAGQSPRKIMVTVETAREIAAWMAAQCEPTSRYD